MTENEAFIKKPEQDRTDTTHRIKYLLLYHALHTESSTTLRRDTTNGIRSYTWNQALLVWPQVLHTASSTTHAITADGSYDMCD